MRSGLSAIPALISDKFPEFAARLDGNGPLGVAVSGGGDSVALLYALAEWKRKSAKPRTLEVFCVDHCLNPLSPQWTQSVADHAARVGAGFTALYWRGEKPVNGISAAARLARHRLLAQAAREKGVAVLCLAHTADDVAEAAAMRGQGSTVGTPKAWSPSPVWPEGRGIFLYRPFLEVRREALRDYLRAIDAAWIDDPANESPHSLRARTRKTLQGYESEASGSETAVRLTGGQIDAPLHRAEYLVPLGIIALDAVGFYALPPETALKVLATAAVCAGGGDRLPRQEKVAALCRQLPDGKAATLCGARLWQSDGIIWIGREVGDIGRNRPGRMSLARETVWDGRFVVRSAGTGEIVSSASARSELGEGDRAWLLSLPEMARGIQPVLVSDEKDNQIKYLLTNQALRQRAGMDMKVQCLVLPRFRAALGDLTRESDLGQQKEDCVLMRENGV